MKVKLGMLSIIVALTLGISACTQKTSEESISDAQEWIKKNDPEAAILELKNAVKNYPNDSLVRLELGKIYLQRGMVAQAEKELRHALSNTQDEYTVLPLRAKSLLLQFKYQEVIDLVIESKNLSLEAATTLYVLQSQAYFQIGNQEAAEEAISSANELSADSPYARLGKAYAAFNKTEIGIALETVDTLLAQSPNFGEALLLKGQLESAQSNHKEALKSFEKYHALQPKLIQGRIYLTDSYIKNRQFDDAEKHINIMLQINKKSPFINQLKSQVLFELKDFSNAKSYAEIAITNGGQNILTSSIAGISAYQLGQSEQAYRHLLPIADKLPEQHELRGLFNLLEYNLGYNTNDSSDLNELGQLSEGNVGLLINSGIELARKNNLPDRVIDFIRSHHGTTLVYYFFKKQQELDPEANADDFRYPGPIPFSKETAILMMSDAVEAASKSLKDPTFTIIDEVVEKIVKGQMQADQYLNANITLKEIEMVKKVLKQKLTNIYHLRVEYPE